MVSGTDQSGGTRSQRRGPERPGLIDRRHFEAVETGGLGAHDFCAVPPSAGDDDANRRPDDIVHHPVQRQRLVGSRCDHGFPHFTRSDPAGDAAERQRIGSEPAHHYTTLGRPLGGGVEPGQPVGTHAEQLECAFLRQTAFGASEQGPMVGLDARVGGDSRGGQPCHVGAAR